MNANKVFYETLRTEFAPRLREIGFCGSGRNFRRVRGEIINTLNLQTWKYGGKCALNMGLHLTFLPIWSEVLPDIKTIKEAECEFRGRMTPNGEADFWWDYGVSNETAQRAARQLIATYFAVGEARFQRFATIESISDMCPIGYLNADDRFFQSDPSFGYMPCTATRIALTMARIHKQMGYDRLAKEFAAKGLAYSGPNLEWTPIFQAIIESCR